MQCYADQRCRLPKGYTVTTLMCGVRDRYSCEVNCRCDASMTFCQGMITLKGYRGDLPVKGLRLELAQNRTKWRSAIT